MSETIQFYTHPMSRGRIVHWMLEELNVPYQTHLVDLTAGEQKKPEYLKINPMGKVPAVIHKGNVITEAAAICLYLADAHPEAQLAPSPTDPRRGTYYRWMFFSSNCVEPAMVDKALSRAPGDERFIGYGTYEKTIGTLESLLSNGPYILGEQFSAADVYIASQIRYGFVTRTLEPRIAFEKYLAYCADRPAYKRFMEKSEEMRASLKG